MSDDHSPEVVESLTWPSLVDLGSCDFCLLLQRITTHAVTITIMISKAVPPDEYATTSSNGKLKIYY